MKPYSIIKLTLGMALLTTTMALPAQARDQINPHEMRTTEWREWHSNSEWHSGSGPAVIPGPGQVVINNADRTIIRNYMGQRIANNCPPGLTISPNGCVPIGKMQTTTRTTTTTTYAIGEPLPETVTYTSVPPTLITQLNPMPQDYEYVVVNGDVVLLSRADRRVIDYVPWTPLLAK